MDAALACAGLCALIVFARSSRGGFSGPIATGLGLLQIPVFVASLWLIALSLGWWTVGIFIAASIAAGVLVNRNNMLAWVNLQPVTGAVGVLLPVAGWMVRGLS